MVTSAWVLLSLPESRVSVTTTRSHRKPQWMSQFNARLLCGATLNFSNKGGATVAKVLQHKVHNKNMHHSTSSETTTTTTTTTNAATRVCTPVDDAVKPCRF